MEQRIAEHRKALAQREDAAALALAQEFATIADTVEAELAKLTAAISTASDAATPTWLYRQALYKKLMLGARAAYLEYGRQAARTIEGGYAAALDYGLRDAGELLTLAGLDPKPLGKRAKDGLLVGMRRRLRKLALPTSLVQLATKAISGGLIKAVKARAADSPIEPAGLVKKIREGLGSILVNVMRAQRTESTTAYRSVVGAQLAATAQVVGWQWAAELDKRPAPCAVCVAMHGQVFAADAPFGAHPGCRCLAIPVIEGVGPAIPARRRCVAG
ncbi:hypothetical protein K2Z83_13495 [Oscillochloris sp. ZM17-4]|uniref:hypothetical protein n=1 Tax=Oscillochloris sp. ZM17-4 TaxID=2866714 RepID=UPI001C734EFA|nr:hypothetical protein [Oscillochloris sp. ZM17-4]MBX0328691.1 hypothetical protein [Oscillochloris sp. ZM17-4]